MVDKNVSVRKEQNSFHGLAAPETPDDVERRVGLSGTGSHYEQQAALSSANRFDGAVDGVALVVAGLFAAAIVVVLFGRDAMESDSILLIVGNVMVVLAAIGVSIYLWRNGRAKLNVDASLDACAYTEARAGLFIK